MIRPKPAAPYPCGDDGHGRPAQEALTARGAANPESEVPLTGADLRPSRMGARGPAFLNADSDVFAAGAHLALLPLTRCRRWTFSRTTPSTESLGSGYERFEHRASVRPRT